MMPLPNGRHYTPGPGYQQHSAPPVVYSTIPDALPDRTSQDQAAQQALYRGISHSQGSVCRPLVYSGLTNRYLPVHSISPVVPPMSNVVPPIPTFGCPPNSVSSTIPLSYPGYFRDPFLQPGFGQGQQYDSSRNCPSVVPLAFAPSGSHWQPSPPDITATEPIQDFLSDDAPFDTQSVGCQVSDNLLGSHPQAYFGSPGEFYQNFPSPYFPAHSFHP
jgi:hypothetical protein